MSQLANPSLPSLDPCELLPAEPTFRDPAGELRLQSTHALRRIHPAAIPEIESFLASPLRRDLERSGDLIATEIAPPPAGAPDGQLWLRHPLIDPISYPWEWTPGQWRAAAELTLRVAAQAVDAGWVLKDATPLNIVFRGPRPVLVDVLSLERRNPASSVWLAYGQFVRTFLLPLLGAKYLHWPLENTLFARDGYEPRTLYRALRPWQRIRPEVLDVVTLASLLEKPGAQKRGRALTPSNADPEFTAHLLKARMARLGRKVRRLESRDPQSDWSHYTRTAAHYQSADTSAKESFVARAVAACQPQSVLDIGANTGAYSVIAAGAGANVVALDSDSAAVQTLWKTAAQKNLPITAMVANIARPTPAVGWRNREQLSLLDRLAGKFDMVLMLAVIHHLILREQIPLDHIAGLCNLLSRRWLVLEWVPVSDPMFQEWLRGREALYGHLTEDHLIRAFSPHFHVSDRTVLGNGRVVLLFQSNRPAHASSPASHA